MKWKKMQCLSSDIQTNVINKASNIAGAPEMYANRETTAWDEANIVLIQ